MDLGSVYGDGLSSGFGTVELEDDQEVRLLYVPQFNGFSLDLTIDLESLLSDKCEWIILVAGEFDKFFEEVEDNGNS